MDCSTSNVEGVSVIVSEDHDENDTHLIITIFYVIFGFIGIAGNGLVIVVMVRIKGLRTTTNLLIVNQSVIDMASSFLLLVQYAAPPLSISTQRRHSAAASAVVCGFWNSDYIFWSTAGASALNLVLLTLERYFAVVRPLVYRSKFSYRSAAVMACVPWLVGFLLEIYWAVANRYSEGGECVVRHPSPAAKGAMGCLLFIVRFFAPLVIMAVVYTSIMKTLRQRRVIDIQLEQEPDARQAQNAHPEPGPPNYRERARKNVVKTMLIVCVSFAICWTPNSIVYIYSNLGGYVDLKNNWYNFTVFLAFGNMCVNPFIYAFKYTSFQKGLKKLFGLKRG